MDEARRLVISIDIDEAGQPQLDADRRLSISALHQLELVSGRRVTLLGDRGWASSGPSDIWSRTSLDDLTETARVVVGPDEPPEGRSHQDETAMHWVQLAATAQARGVHIEPGDLAALPHDVEVSREIRERLARSAP